jgi:hypothetical protein
VIRTEGPLVETEAQFERAWVGLIGRGVGEKGSGGEESAYAGGL